MADYSKSLINSLIKNVKEYPRFSKEEIEAFIDKYFTICWQHWFRMQIPFLVRHRSFFGDLETWNVWGAIGISQFTDYSKQVKNRVVEDPRTYADLYLHLLRHTPKNGINASLFPKFQRSLEPL